MCLDWNDRNLKICSSNHVQLVRQGPSKPVSIPCRQFFCIWGLRPVVLIIKELLNLAPILYWLNMTWYDCLYVVDLDGLHDSRPKKAVFLEELSSTLDDQEWLDFENMSQVHIMVILYTSVFVLFSMVSCSQKLAIWCIPFLSWACKEVIG